VSKKSRRFHRPVPLTIMRVLSSNRFVIWMAARERKGREGGIARKKKRGIADLFLKSSRGKRKKGGGCDFFDNAEGRTKAEIYLVFNPKRGSRKKVFWKGERGKTVQS